MAMTPYNGDLSQALKWMQNNAPAIQTLVRKKADWYSQYHDQFWSDWQTNVFDLRTANPFGLMVWCIILGVPSSLFGLYPDTVGWAYGQFRQNFVYSGTDPNLPNPNLIGGNFAGGGNTTLLNLNEVRYALRLRYAALVSNGSIQEINRMLNYIFNNGEPWDFQNKKYFYVADLTIQAAGISNEKIYLNNWQGNHFMSPAARTNRSLSVANYSAYLGTTTAPGPLAPDGVSTATTVTYAAGAGGNLYQLLNNTPGAPTTYYQVCKAGTSGHQFVIGNDKMVPAALVTFDLFAGQIVAQSGGAVGTMYPIAGQPGWYFCGVTFTEPTGLAGDSMVTYPIDRPGTVQQFASQAETSAVPTSYIPTTNAAVTVPADYTIDHTAGTVVMNNAPALAAVLSWSGNWGGTTATNQQFGTGNGSNKNFTLTRPPGSVRPIANAMQMEYRIGAGLALSDQFVALLNSQQYGITPSCGGVKYTVIKET